MKFRIYPRAELGRGCGLAVGSMLAVSSHAASNFDDDFADGIAGPQWSLITDSPSELSLAETGGQLQVIANSPAFSSTDALYLSSAPDGFTLGTDVDFRITLDYAFNSFDASQASLGDLLGLTFGVGRDLDGTDSAAIGFAVSRQQLGPVTLNGTALGEAHRIDDVQTENILNLLGPTSGTFEISYDALNDDLTLGVDSLTFTLENTVQAIWQADELFVSFGARGNGFSWVAGDATLDNFTIQEGRVIATSLDGDYNGDGFVSQGDLDLVLLNWGDTVLPPTFETSGLAEGTFDGQISQNELDGVLLNWGNGQAPTTVAVPEPASLCLLGLIALATTGRRIDITKAV